MIDSSLVFDGTLNPTAGVAITSTRVSTNVLDLLVARDIGAGEDLALHVQVLTAFTAGGAATLTVDYEVCDTAGGTYLALISSPVIPVAQLIVGAPLFRYVVPVNQILNATAGVLKAPGRYVRLNYTVATGPMTAGTVFSYMTPVHDRNEYYSYPKNYTAYVAPGEI